MKLSRSTSSLLSGILWILAVVGFCSGAFAETGVGQPAPSLKVALLDGQTFDLAALRGKVVIVSLWATWCPPCRAEMPVLDAFYRRHHAQGLEVIGLSADRPHDRSDVIKVMQAYSYPAAMLDDAKVNDLGDPTSLPEMIVIGRDGVVHAKLTSEEKLVTENTLDDVVLPLLSKNAAYRSSPETTHDELVVAK